MRALDLSKIKAKPFDHDLFYCLWRFTSLQSLYVGNELLGGGLYSLTAFLVFIFMLFLNFAVFLFVILSLSRWGRQLSVYINIFRSGNSFFFLSIRILCP